MTELGDQAHRLAMLSERSSYIENVLCHSLVAGLSRAVWRRDPAASLQVFNAEVDDSGFDLVLSLAGQVRYVQLKQTHAGKTPPHCSIRMSFAAMAGACVVLMSYSVIDLELKEFRFFGGAAAEVLDDLSALRPSKSAGRKDSDGQRKLRLNYRDVPLRLFRGPLTLDGLLDELFHGLPSKLTLADFAGAEHVT